VSEKKSKTALDKGIERLRRLVRSLPSRPGVYQMVSESGEVLYVGKAKNLPKRVISYAQVARLPQRLRRMVSFVHDVVVIVTETEREALLLEANLIQKHMPRYNVVFRDNKSLPYLRLTSGRWPRLQKHRGKRTGNDDYFGPFPSVKDVVSAQKTLAKAFLLRSCSDHTFETRTRPCLEYHIKRCSAPCVGKISHTDYMRDVADLRLFFKGKGHKIYNSMIRQMTELSDRQAYEDAARIRDRIQALSLIQNKNDIFMAHKKDVDVVGVAAEGRVLALQIIFIRAGVHLGGKVFFSRLIEQGEAFNIESAVSQFLIQFYQENESPSLILWPYKEGSLSRDILLALGKGTQIQLRSPSGETEKRLLKHAETNGAEALKKHLSHHASIQESLIRLKDWLGIRKTPKRIEVYDNSHLRGQHAYGVMIVATPEGFETKSYRRFRIPQTLNSQDDVAMMAWVLRRRFEGYEKGSPYPDLLLIDGGRGQVGAVDRVLNEMELPPIAVLGLAKGENRERDPGTFYRPGHLPQKLPAYDPLLYYLERLRDEAHRFAIGTHGVRRLKQLRSSELQAIGGIGAARKKLLLQYFGSLDALRQAKVADLIRVPGIGRLMAEKICKTLEKHV
jgi:excinuclease ABC subunit C